MGWAEDFFMGTEGTPGEHGIDVAYIDDYADYQGIRNQLKDYWQGLMSFQEPEMFQRYTDRILDNQYSNLDRIYLGDPGNRSQSAMGLAAQAGAMTGVGPKATLANTQKVNYELAAKKAAAQQAIDNYRMRWMGDSANQAAMGMAKLPQGQRFYAEGYNIQPTAGTPGFLSKAADAALSAGMAYATGGMSEVAKAGKQGFGGFNQAGWDNVASMFGGRS